MKCKKCGKEYPENELMKGICYDCFEEKQNQSEVSKVIEEIKEETHYTNSQKSERNINGLSSAYHGLSSICFLLSIILAFIFAMIFQEFIVSASVFVAFIFIGLFLQTSSEILQLLEDIKNK